MLSKAVVVFENGRPMGKVVRSEACAACRACDFGQKEEVLVALPRGEYREGEEVELSLEDRNLTLAALAAYGIPLAMFLAGLLGGGALFGAFGWPREAGQGICAVVLTAAGYLILKRLEKRFRGSGRFAPSLARCRADSERQEAPRAESDG